MKRKALLLTAMLTLGLAANAQWRVGATVGADCNRYSIDRQYVSDFSYSGRWGVTDNTNVMRLMVPHGIHNDDFLTGYDKASSYALQGMISAYIRH